MADFLDNTPPVDPNRCERAYLVGVQTPDMQPGEAQELLGELKELVENLRIEVVSSDLINLRAPTPATLLGSGRTDSVIAQAKGLDCDLIVIDESLSPAQQRNWEKLSGLAVIDREEVILDIFADRAHTREAVLQVALARMEYSLPRLSRAWTHLSRQRGKGKLGGEGETQLEQDRRLVRDRITRLKHELSTVQKQRGVQRSKRLRVPVPTCSVVGYTNAGKSSLLNRITGAGVLVENALFATLDPTIRKTKTPAGKEFTLTDTVGFVRHLPHQLVEAFRSSLEEVKGADLILHIVDGSDEAPEEQIAAVREVLNDIEASNIPELIVINKADQADQDQLVHLLRREPHAVVVSALTGQGIEELLLAIEEDLPQLMQEVDLVVPYSRGDLISRVHELGDVIDLDHLAEGTHVHARVPKYLANVLQAARV
ncbi:MAG TPA: GTPase HflX [Actinobacteria bacterium]|nr:GTPase HflX [Actinomycetota bacterium]